MARGLKTRGLIEVKQFRDRVRRQLALGRISRDDAEWLVEAIDKIEARIVAMDERGDEI